MWSSAPQRSARPAGASVSEGHCLGGLTVTKDKPTFTPRPGLALGCSLSPRVRQADPSPRPPGPCSSPQAAAVPSGLRRGDRKRHPLGRAGDTLPSTPLSPSRPVPSCQQFLMALLSECHRRQALPACTAVPGQASPATRASAAAATCLAALAPWPAFSTAAAAAPPRPRAATAPPPARPPRTGPPARARSLVVPSVLRGRLACVSLTLTPTHSVTHTHAHTYTHCLAPSLASFPPHPFSPSLTPLCPCD